MTSTITHESNARETHQPTHEDLQRLYSHLLDTYGYKSERVVRVASAPMPTLTGRVALKAMLFSEKRKRPEPVVNNVKETIVSLPVLQAHAKNSVRAGHLTLEEIEGGTPRLLFKIDRTVYGTLPSSEREHIYTATDLYKELSLEVSDNQLGGSHWYDYLSKVSTYLGEDHQGYPEFVTGNHELIEAVEQEMGAYNPSADHFSRF